MFVRASGTLALIAALALLLLPTALGQPMLVGVAPSTVGGEGFRVVAPPGHDMHGWQVTDGEGTWTFGHLFPGKAGTWVVANQTRWSQSGGPPSVALGTGVAAGAFALGNGGDELRLLDPSGALVDAMAWGNHTTSGFIGSVPAPANAVLVRDQDGNGAWIDTDRQRDWVTPRVHRFAESRLERTSFVASHVTLYASPDSSHQVLSQLIHGARDRLAVHVYELRSATLVDALVAARHSHPQLVLEVMVDSDPTGMDARERHATADALGRIVAAGGRAVLAGNGRYDDVHLKVLVADDKVAVQSENWVDSGVPIDPSTGNRGWGAVVASPAMAQWFWDWMAADRGAWDTKAFDVATFDPSFRGWDRPAVPATGSYQPVVAPLELPGPILVEPLVSPEHTEDPRRDPLAALIDGAQRRVVVQQMDLAPGAANRLGWRSDDPLLAALERAAARVPVRVQAAPPFNSGPGNQAELDRLAAAGATAGTMARPGILTMHNKGLVVDDVVVLGSMNGNHHSRSANREVDLIIHSPAAAAYFDALLTADFEGAGTPRAWDTIGHDVMGIPGAQVPTLLVALFVAMRRRW